MLPTVLHADRIIRLLVEDGLEEMPHMTKTVLTPTGVRHDGVGWQLPYQEKICGVSIVRAVCPMLGAVPACAASLLASLLWPSLISSLTASMPSSLRTSLLPGC